NATASTPSKRGATLALPSTHARPLESAPFLCSNLRGRSPANRRLRAAPQPFVQCACPRTDCPVLSTPDRWTGQPHRGVTVLGTGRPCSARTALPVDPP